MADGVRIGEKVTCKIVQSKGTKSMVRGQMVPSKAAQQKENQDGKEETNKGSNEGVH